MLCQVNGLHHVTSLASDARRVDAFFTDALGLRRVKKTVNFDAPDVYHLYYGDEIGTPGSVMTCFPFRNAARGRRGTGEVGATAFSIPGGASRFWADRLAAYAGRVAAGEDMFGDRRVNFTAPDGDRFALVEDPGDMRAPWTGGGIGDDYAIRGFHSASLCVVDAAPTEELLRFMGYVLVETRGAIRRMVVPGGTANIIDVDEQPDAAPAREGAGAVHHIAFSVDNRARQTEVREALLDVGYRTTPVIDRDYFHAIYFRTPAGILFEVATNEPGFDRDEAVGDLGRALKLPSRHEHLRERLERQLPEIGGVRWHTRRAGSKAATGGWC